MVLGVFKKLLHLGVRHVIMKKSLEILNIFNNLTLKQISKKTQALFKKLEYRF